MKKKYIHSELVFKNRRRELRNSATPYELKLWEYIRNRKLGYKFQRQHSIGNFIVDFYCASKRLIIELDGKHHLNNIEYDRERSFFLEDLGYKVIRFSNSDIIFYIEKVVAQIKEHLGTSSPA